MGATVGTDAEAAVACGHYVHVDSEAGLTCGPRKEPSAG